LHKYDDVFEEKIATEFTDFTEWDGEISLLPSGQGATRSVVPWPDGRNDIAAQPYESDKTV